MQFFLCSCCCCCRTFELRRELPCFTRMTLYSLTVTLALSRSLCSGKGLHCVSVCGRGMALLYSLNCNRFTRMQKRRKFSIVFCFSCCCCLCFSLFFFMTNSFAFAIRSSTQTHSHPQLLLWRRGERVGRGGERTF